MNDKCMASYNSINSKLVNVFKTVPTKESNKSLIKTDGDLTKLKTHNIFNKYISSKKEYANLITADGGFTWKNENYQEQEAYRLILGEIMNCLYNINKDGSFILKVFETFTDVTIKMIYLCGSFFKETYMYKPFMSRTSNSEKYIVFKNFKYDPKDKKLKNMLDKLLTIFKSIDGNKKYIHDIFPSMPINIKYIEQIKYMNIMIMNKQNIMINMIKSFIDKKNNYGVEYHDYMKKQIENTKFWINKFYTDEQNLNKIKKELKEELSKIENYNSNEALLLYK
jgi:23S rRNA U2552 (ribose-2'-O)-methylase RlmE/FtsJ